MKDNTNRKNNKPSTPTPLTHQELGGICGGLAESTSVGVPLFSIGESGRLALESRLTGVPDVGVGPGRDFAGIPDDAFPNHVFGHGRIN
jgi:hypothetical protein